MSSKAQDPVIHTGVWWQPVQGQLQDVTLGSLCWLLQIFTPSIAVAT